MTQSRLSKYPRNTHWCIPKAPSDNQPSLQRAPNTLSPENYLRNLTKCSKMETVMIKKYGYDHIKTDSSLIKR